MTKKGLTVSLEPNLLEAGLRAVEDGSASSLSDWVGEALLDRVRRDQKRSLLQRAIEDYEAEFGEITEEEIARQTRQDREGAVVVRARARNSKKKSA